MSADASRAITRQRRAQRPANIDAREANVFDELRHLERDRRALRHDRAGSAGVREEQGVGAEALAGYKEINLRAMRLLQPGRLPRHLQLLVQRQRRRCSPRSSRGVGRRRDAGDVVEKRMQGRDHPVLLGVPETYYLKCFISRRLA